MSIKRRLFIGLLVALIYSVTLAVVNAHASVPQEPIDKSAAIMWTFTILIVIQRLFF